MKKYVCTIEKEYSESLISKGYHLTDTYEIDGNEVFVLMPPKGTKNYDKLDKSKCFFTNKRYFKGGE
jgi:hypothetical protein